MIRPELIAPLEARQTFERLPITKWHSQLKIINILDPKLCDQLKNDTTLSIIVCDALVRSYTR